MLETSARLLRLLSLLQSRRFWSGAELSERLEVTGRTLRRDIDRLRALGYPVHATPGVAGGYQLGAGASLPPLQLADDEALAVSIGLQTAASTTVTGIDEAAVRALAKLERVLPSHLRRRASALRASILSLPRAGSHVDPDVLTTLASACSDHTRVHFRYLARSTVASAQTEFAAGSRGRRTKPKDPVAGTTSERSVDPVGLVSSGYRWYLVAWDNAREAWRTFRVDRIGGQVSVGQRFVPRPLPEQGDLQKYVSRSVSVAVYSHKARIIVHAPRQVVCEHISPAAGMLEALDDERCVLVTGGQSLESLALHLTLLGLDFEVQEPPELIDYLRTLHQRLGRVLVASGRRASRSGDRARTRRKPR